MSHHCYNLRSKSRKIQKTELEPTNVCSFWSYLLPEVYKNMLYKKQSEIDALEERVREERVQDVGEEDVQEEESIQITLQKYYLLFLNILKSIYALFVCESDNTIHHSIFEKKSIIDEHGIKWKTIKIKDEETKQEASQETKQETSQEASQEASQETKQEASQETKQEASQETSQETNHETNHEAKQEASQETNQEASQETKQEASQETNQETNPITRMLHKTDEDGNTYVVRNVQVRTTSNYCNYSTVADANTQSEGRSESQIVS